MLIYTGILVSAYILGIKNKFHHSQSDQPSDVSFVAVWLYFAVNVY